MNYTLTAHCLFKGISQSISVNFTNNTKLTDTPNIFNIRDYLNVGIKILNAFNQETDQTFNIEDIIVDNISMSDGREEPISTSNKMLYITGEIGFVNINEEGVENNIKIGKTFVYPIPNETFIDNRTIDSVKGFKSKIRAYLLPLMFEDLEDTSKLNQINAQINFINITIQ